MDISLKSRSDIVSWGSVFRILAYESCVPIWKIIDVPEEMINNPDSILDTAKSFFVDRASLWSPEVMTSDEEISHHIEAQRMIDLGHLYDCFGRIVKSCGEEGAVKLYEWGERHFINEKPAFWLSWRFVFSSQLRNQTAIISSISSGDFKKLTDIIKDEFRQASLRQEKLDEEFELLCQKFSADPEEMSRLNNVSVSDLIIYNNFDDVNEELRSIFGFDGILSTDCAYKIWRLINADFEIEARENIFQWGAVKSKDLGLKVKQKLKRYCLSV